jgi:hypothetical protein
MRKESKYYFRCFVMSGLAKTERKNLLGKVILAINQ